MTLFRPEKRQVQTVPWREIADRQGRLPAPSPGTDAALTLSAVYGSVDKITSIISTFPLDIYRRVPNGVRIESPEPYPVVRTPSTEVDAVDWRATIIASWLLRGNAFGLVTLNGSSPMSLELIDNDRVTASRLRKDAPTLWKVDGQPMERWPSGQLWVAPGKIWDPGWPLGVSVLQYAMMTAGIGLSSRKFGADFFAGGGHPTAAIIGPPDKEVNEDMARKVKRRLLDAIGANREPIVLGGGWKLEQIQIAPNESQFLETIKANATDIARFFGIPATIIDAPTGSGMTYNNATQKADDLLKFTINGWVVKLERALNTLVKPGDFVRLNVDSLLRGDLSARYLAYDRGLRDGFLSRNEVRATEDLPPIEGGDEYLWPPYRAFPLDSDKES